MTERPNAITIHGNPLTLVGDELTTGSSLPDFEVRNNEMKPVKRDDTSGLRLFVTVPSLDTPVCDVEARTFNQRVAELGDNVRVMIVSRDTPFAQKRYCAAQGIDKVETLSDFVDGNLGKAWGLYTKENGLLARAIVLADADNNVRYTQLVPAIEQEPNYDEALAAVKAAL